MRLAACAGICYTAFMTLSECKRALEEIGVQPTKSLGQNFLVDQNILRILIESAAISHGEAVVEIGPGLGVLTAGLLEAGAEVKAIEKDGRLVQFLKRRFARRRNLELIHADALTVDSLATSNARKVVANLPYSISTAILKRFVESPVPPTRMVLMLQREVGERLAASPGTDDYGILTVFTQVKYRVQLRHVVTRRCFYPPPDVDSAIVILDHAPHPLLGAASEEAFHQLVQIGFGQRRKQFAKLLRQAGHDPERISIAFAAVGLEEHVRAEAVSVGQFLRLAKEFHEGRNL